GAAEVAHDGDEVAGDVGAAVAVPAQTGVAAAADVDVGDPVPGGGQGWSEETVGVPAVADTVRQDHERALPGHLIGEVVTGDAQVLGHDDLHSLVNGTSRRLKALTRCVKRS